MRLRSQFFFEMIEFFTLSSKHSYIICKFIKVDQAEA